VPGALALFPSAIGYRLFFSVALLALAVPVGAAYCREMEDSGDPWNLNRFVDAQRDTFDRALAELKAGRKTTHWMWFVFPQWVGLGRSAMAQQYGLRGSDEALAYLTHPILGPRLVVSCRAVLSVEARSAREILGSPDDDKLRSCATLFSRLPEAPPEFAAVLQRYFEGRPDPLTLELLAGGRSGIAAG